MAAVTSAADGQSMPALRVDANHLQPPVECGPPGGGWRPRAAAPTGAWGGGRGVYQRRRQPRQPASAGLSSRHRQRIPLCLTAPARPGSGAPCVSDTFPGQNWRLVARCFPPPGPHSRPVLSHRLYSSRRRRRACRRARRTTASCCGTRFQPDCFPRPRQRRPARKKSRSWTWVRRSPSGSRPAITTTSKTADGDQRRRRARPWATARASGTSSRDRSFPYGKRAHGAADLGPRQTIASTPQIVMQDGMEDWLGLAREPLVRGSLLLPPGCARRRSTSTPSPARRSSNSAKGRLRHDQADGLLPRRATTCPCSPARTAISCSPTNHASATPRCIRR